LEQLTTTHYHTTQSAPLDARIWLLWVCSGMAAATTARNPLYSLIILLAAWAVQAQCALAGRRGLPLLPLGVAVITLSALFNGLLTHFGATVLLYLPAQWPIIGGPLTLEAIVYGACNGLALLALLGIFSALNVCVPTHELVRLTPRSLHSLGVVLLIAASYGPQTARHLQLIREAQAVRGHKLRRVRDWRPIVIPLLVGGLERSVGLAEAMVARGYGATENVGPSAATRAVLTLSLLLLLGGWLLAVFGNWLGLPLLALGMAALGAVLLRLRRLQQISVYRPRPLGWNALVVGLLAALTLLVVLLPLPWFDRTTLVYSPYPRLALPTFDPLIGLALALLAAPALVGQQKRVTHHA
jgi:energy-coupling factor transport system permease protein